MIGKVSRGQGVSGLLRYLFGPGRHNEHTDPHVVAGWDDPAALEPELDAAGRPDLGPLVHLLDLPLQAIPGRPPTQTVWHCSLRAAPGDRRLSDAEWAEVAGDVVTRTGLAPASDDGGCRWVAVRHADDHVHLVVTLARQDGRRVTPRNDFYRVGEACRAAELRLGLRKTDARDRTADARPARGEQEKAARIGLREPARTTLRREVRSAAASAHGVEEFLARLRAGGVMVQGRQSQHAPGELTGYAVALPGHRAAAGGVVWYGGGKLAADLSLPKLRRRWDDADQPASTTASAGLSVEQRAAVWAQARRTTAEAAQRMQRLVEVDPAAAADTAWAASDALAVAARLAEGRRGGPLSRAAEDMDRAGREAWGRTPAPSPTGSGLRSVARLLAVTGRARRDETTQLLALVLNLAAIVEATARLRATQDRAAQAAAARSAAEQLARRQRELVAAATLAAAGRRAVAVTPPPGSRPDPGGGPRPPRR